MLKNWVLVAVSLASCTSALADPTPYPGQYDVRDHRHSDYRDDRRDDHRGGYNYGSHDDGYDSRRNDNGYPYDDRPTGFTCMSSSQGYPFLGSDSLELMARTKAIRACQSDSHTLNQECAADVTCRPNAPSWQRYECTTSSQSYPFAGAGSNELEAQFQAIRSCQRDSHTLNAECTRNIQCTSSSHQSYGYYSCMAESQGYLFTSSGRDSALAKMQAIRTCQSDSHTLNPECMNTVQCEAVYESPRLSVCTTESQSIPFTVEERKFRFEVMADVIRQCQHDAHTINSQCRQNVQCESERY